MKLYSYQTPSGATRTLRHLRDRFPGAEFKLVVSPLRSYPFRWLIAHVSDGRTVAYVERKAGGRVR